MNELLEKTVKEVAATYGRDRHRLLDIARDIQARFGHVSSEAMDLIAREVKAARVDVEGVVTFYAFLSKERMGRHVIRVSDCMAAKMRGADQVTRAFETELGIRCGETTKDGAFTLTRTSCIGMCDQGPAALCDEVPITRLSTDRVRDMVRILRETGDPRRMVRTLGEGQNGSDMIRSMVHNNIRRQGEVIFAPMTPGAAIRNALAMSPSEVIRSLKTARLRGRGGAGFPTGMKWEFAIATRRVSARSSSATPTRESPGPSRTGTSCASTPTR